MQWRTTSSDNQVNAYVNAGPKLKGTFALRSKDEVGIAIALAGISKDASAPAAQTLTITDAIGARSARETALELTYKLDLPSHCNLHLDANTSLSRTGASRLELRHWRTP